ncbi:mate-domain-containing protein [Lophiotrema nucula]|uniref:Mate-domain-containing protein n=1 Tax=Lophiotrema nucula TaxID=690887 RepID=A0A6A5ZKT7_9PLEO|nr:mate-domain-containing protein [Lophiotrema nucula]
MDYGDESTGQIFCLAHRSQRATFLPIYMSSMLVISAQGKIELRAVSVAATTANITGFILFQGLSTSLDILCAQGWGSGNPQLGRLRVQRMVVLLSAVSIPIATVWFSAEHLFSYVLPDPRTSMLAGLYLKLLILAIPGFLTFEAGKRILTAQGRFFPVTGILCAGTCTNAFLGWLLVWISWTTIFTRHPGVVELIEHALALIAFMR